MPAMAAAPLPPPRLDSVLSFGNALPGADRPATDAEPVSPTFSDAGSDYDDDDAGFEFAFAPPLAAPGDGVLDLAPADDLFAHGRILPAYPVFDRHLLLDRDGDSAAATPAPPSPDTYCAWAPGSPARERDTFPKSASTGEARRSWRLRDLVSGGGGRSHSDGKEKFLFLHSTTTAAPSKMAGNKAAAPAEGKSRPAGEAAKPSAPTQKQSKKKSSRKAAAGAGGVTEMDMATAHKFFYGKPGSGALAGHRRQQSYLPYRPGIVGFFTAAHAIGRSHHPY